MSSFSISEKTTAVSHAKDTPDYTNEKQKIIDDAANNDFAGFVAKHFLDDSGNPDRTKTPEPIPFTLYSSTDRKKMWQVIQFIRGLVLLRKDAFRQVIGWDDALYEETMREFKKREGLFRFPHNLHAAQLNAEPKLFIKQWLGIELDSKLPTPPPEKRVYGTPLTLNNSNLLDGNVTNRLCSLVDYGGLYNEWPTRHNFNVIGWDKDAVMRTIKEQKLDKWDPKLDQDLEAKYNEKYWASRAEHHLHHRHNKTDKLKPGDAYFWALHNAIRAKILQRPAQPPIPFSFAQLPGTYIVKMAWRDLKEEFQFPGWDSKLATAQFSSVGHEPATHEMKLHIFPPAGPSQPASNQLRGTFHFGLIEGEISLATSLPGQAPTPTSSNSQRDNTSGSCLNTGTSTTHIAAASGTQDRRQTRGQKRKLEEESNHTNSNPPKKRDHRRSHPSKPHGHNISQRGVWALYPPNDPIPLTKHTVTFVIRYKLTCTKRNTGGGGDEEDSNSVEESTDNDIMSKPACGRFFYYDGDRTGSNSFLGAKGYLHCAELSDTARAQKISIYRASEGKPLLDVRNFESD